jgi:uncharacterized protein (DUF1330 family)
MPAFVIADVSPDDVEAYRASGYLEAAARTSKEYGGFYRARGGALTVLEGEWEPERIVLIEFPSMERLLAWYNSAEYQEWVAVRREHIPDSRLVAIEGVD